MGLKLSISNNFDNKIHTEISVKNKKISKIQPIDLSLGRKGRIGKYNIKRVINQGCSCTVYKAKDMETMKNVAIKVLNNNMSEEDQKLIDAEIGALTSIQTHENIIGFKGFNKGTFYQTCGKKEEVKYIVIELGQGGELYDYISKEKYLDESTACFYFKQLLQGLKQCHKNGFVHRDIKLTNLVLDKRRKSLKLIDFGLAQPYNKDSESPIFQDKVGTRNYQAPEFHREESYNGIQTDIFATGVALFKMVSGSQPFGDTKPNSKLYNYIAKNQTNLFWKFHQQNQNVNFSPELKDLTISLLASNPNKRPSIQQIFDHPWMQKSD